jgi:hypothetical protein
VNDWDAGVAKSFVFDLTQPAAAYRIIAQRVGNSDSGAGQNSILLTEVRFIEQPVTTVQDRLSEVESNLNALGPAMNQGLLDHRTATGVSFAQLSCTEDSLASKISALQADQTAAASTTEQLDALLEELASDRDAMYKPIGGATLMRSTHPFGTITQYSTTPTILSASPTRLQADRGPTKLFDMPADPFDSGDGSNSVFATDAAGEIVLDRGNSLPIQRLEIYTGTGTFTPSFERISRHYEIYSGSSAAGPWVLQTVHDIATPQPTEVTMYTIPTPTLSSRYVRMVWNNVYSGAYSQLTEIVIYEVTGATFPVANGFDGDVATHTRMFAAGAEVQLDYGRDVTASSFVVLPSADLNRWPRQVQVSSSTSPTGPWTLAGTQSTGNLTVADPINTELASATTAQYWRVQFLDVQNGGSQIDFSEFVLQELNIYVYSGALASRTLQQQIQNAIGFDDMPATMKNGSVASLYETVSGMSLEPVRVATGITQAQEDGTEASLATKLQAVQASLAPKPNEYPPSPFTLSEVTLLAGKYTMTLADGNYTVEASSSFNANAAPFKAFDADSSSYWTTADGRYNTSGAYIGGLETYVNGLGTPGEWIQFTTPSAVAIRSVVITCSSVFPFRAPKNFTLAALVDGEWLQVMEGSGVNDWVVGTPKLFAFDSVRTAASYRLITSFSNHAGVALGQVRFFTGDPVVQELQALTGYAGVPAGWRDGSAAAPNNLYDKILQLEQRIAALEPF